MSYDLAAFHFNPRKAGQIFKQFCKDRGVSKSSLAKKCGTTYDTIDNIFSGKVQDITFERVFKFCVALEIPLEVYMMMMLKDEDIDFQDQILLYDNQEDNVLPISDIDTSQVPSPVPDTVVAAAEAVTAAESVPGEVRAPSDHTCPGYSREDVSMLLDRMERQHARQTAELQATNERLFKIFEMMLMQGE